MLLALITIIVGYCPVWVLTGRKLHPTNDTEFLRQAFKKAEQWLETNGEPV